MVSLDFIRANPAMQSYMAGQRASEEREDRLLRREQSGMAMDDMRRRRAEDQAASSALQGIYADRSETAPAAPVTAPAGGQVADAGAAAPQASQAAPPAARAARRVGPEAWERAAAAPGLSATHRLQFQGQAETLRQREEAKRERAAQNMAAFLKAGMIEPAKTWAAEAGIANIPESFWADKAQQQALLSKLEIEGKQADIAHKTRGFAKQAVTLTGEGGAAEIGSFDPSTGTVTPTGQRGYGRGAGRGATGNDPARVREANVLVEKGVYPDFATAYTAVRSAVTPSAEQIRLKGLSWLNGQKDETGLPRYRTPEQQAAALGAYERFAKGDTEGALQQLQTLTPQKPQDEAGVFTSLWRSLTGTGAAPAAAPAPAAPPPTGAAPAPRPTTPAPAAAGPVGTRENPHAPQTDEDFAALPSGAIYRDPDDGQLYAKP